MADAFGRALLDHHRGRRDEPLRQRDGDDAKTHHVQGFYFGEYGDQPGAEWALEYVDGPLLDVGAGSGRDALHFQDRFETVALDRSDALVTLLEKRGVDRVVEGDMFALPEQFERNSFRSVLAVGGQFGLGRSMAGLEALLADFATVTTPDATAVVDSYDPTYAGIDGKVGYRPDPTPGLAYRTFHYEYGDLVGPSLLFRLFGPDRLREAAGGTEWSVAEIHRPGDAHYYRAALVKDDAAGPNRNG